MFRKLVDRMKEFKLTMRMKLTLSLSAIAVTLLVSSVISIMEYYRMSDYVSDLIADNIRSVNVAQKLSEVTNKYNLDLLTLIGDNSVNTLPDFHQKEFMGHCDSLRNSLTSDKMVPLTDSVVYAYSAYMLTSLELNDVMLSGLNNYRSYNKKYSYSFEGDDQLVELNDGITELTGENQMLRKRVANLRAKIASASEPKDNGASGAGETDRTTDPATGQAKDNQ